MLKYWRRGHYNSLCWECRNDLWPALWLRATEQRATEVADDCSTLPHKRRPVWTSELLQIQHFELKFYHGRYWIAHNGTVIAWMPMGQMVVACWVCWMCRKAQGNPQLQDSSWTGSFGAEDRNPWYSSWMARTNCTPSVSLLAPAAADGQQCIAKAVSRQKSSSGSLVIIRFISYLLHCSFPIFSQKPCKIHAEKVILHQLCHYLAEGHHRKETGPFLCFRFMALKFCFIIYDCKKPYCSILQFIFWVETATSLLNSGY